jgi:hypothetical protein
MVQAISTRGAHGHKALQVLGKHLREAHGEVGSVAEHKATTAHTAADTLTVSGKPSAADDVSKEVEQAILQSGTPLSGSLEAQVHATLHASAAPTGSKRMRLMTDAEARAAQSPSEQTVIQETSNVCRNHSGVDKVDLKQGRIVSIGPSVVAASATPASAIPSKSIVPTAACKDHYVKVIARLCESRLRASGIGSLQILQHGSILQLGDSNIRARFVSEEDQRFGDSAETNRVKGASTWSWEVLWGGGDGETQDVLRFAQAIVSAAGVAGLRQL